MPLPRPLRGLRATAIATTLVGSLVIALTATGAFLAPASAHTDLASSVPADGETLDRLPGVVTLTFTEELDAKAWVVLTGPDGNDHGIGAPVVDGADVTQELATDAPAGEYSVAYRVISADGHPVTGTTTFTAREAGPDAGAQEQTPAAQEPAQTPEAEQAPSADEETSFLGEWALYIVILLVLVAAALAARAVTRRTRG